jgi:nucleoside-diphosphate-sugar epimerase
MLRAAAEGSALHEVVPAAPFDAVHGNDAAEALLMLAARPDAPRLLNMAGLTLTYGRIAAALGDRIEVVEQPAPADLPLVDDSRLRALGWAPRRALDAILSETLREMTMKEKA